MQSSVQMMLKLAGALAIVVASFLTTTKILDHWGVLKVSNTAPIAPPMQDPAYNAATLPHLSAGQTLDFSNGQSRNALLGGWSAAEAKGTWSSQNLAYLGFIVDGTPAARQAFIRGPAFFAPGTLEAQRVEIWSAGKKLAEYQLKNQELKGQPADLKVPLDGVSAGNGAVVVLDLHFPDAKPANQIAATSDARILGLFLGSIQLTP